MTLQSKPDCWSIVLFKSLLIEIKACVVFWGQHVFKYQSNQKDQKVKRPRSTSQVIQGLSSIYRDLSVSFHSYTMFQDLQPLFEGKLSRFQLSHISSYSTFLVGVLSPCQGTNRPMASQLHRQMRALQEQQQRLLQRNATAAASPRRTAAQNRSASPIRSVSPLQQPGYTRAVSPETSVSRLHQPRVVARPAAHVSATVGTGTRAQAAQGMPLEPTTMRRMDQAAVRVLLEIGQCVCFGPLGGGNQQITTKVELRHLE